MPIYDDKEDWEGENDEDENGNIYFTLYEFERKEKGKINNDEGIAIRYSDGTFKQFTTENSGMPFNHTNCVVYDKRIDSLEHSHSDGYL